jgi:hypothetical protein
MSQDKIRDLLDLQALIRRNVDACEYAVEIEQLPEPKAATTKHRNIRASPACRQMQAAAGRKSDSVR